MTKLEILGELYGIEIELSEENLTWDGERPASEVIKARRLLEQKQTRLHTQFIALTGRKPTEEEIYETANRQRG